jgi:exopolysaccharide biosynthesis polyprenyl glycosylphosphotransferase
MLTQEPGKAARPDAFVEEEVETPAWEQSAADDARVPDQSKPLLAKILEHDWIVALFYVGYDVVCWVLLYGIVGYIRRDEFFTTPFEFVLVDCIVLAVILQSLYIIGGYNRNIETRSLTYTAEHVLAIAAAAAISSLIIYSAAAYDASMKPSRGVLLISFVAFLPLSLVYRRFMRRHIATSTAQRTFLVIGSGQMAAQFYENYRQSPNHQQLEFVDNDTARVGSTIAGEGSPIIQGGIAAKLAKLDERYSGVILAESMDRLGRDLVERLVRTQFQRTRVYTLESFYEAHWRHVPMQMIDPFWPLQMGFQLARISPYHYLKRLCDIVAATVLLVISSPLMAMAWALIRLTSKGPAIFKQVRVGREGQPFTVYKFRTMAHHGTAAQLSVSGSRGANFTAGGGERFVNPPREAGDSALVKAEGSEVSGDETEEDIYTRRDDPRVTRVGRWLRKLRIDELPQLWNVFKGDISLIGPRAEWIKCVERYEKRIPFYHFRHLVKPGITGWAQVNYPYGESEEDAVAKLQYDLYYIRHYSLKLDAMIVLKTVHTMLFGKGR